MNDLPNALAFLAIIAVGFASFVTYLFPGLATNTVSEQEPMR